MRRSRVSQIVDPDLGDIELVRRRGRWRGTVQLTADCSVPLVLPGSRRGPHPEASALARTIVDEFAATQDSILAALAEHRTPHVESDAPVRDESRPLYASVVSLDGQSVIEIGYAVAWDDEHTLGARLRDGQLVELCGSVLEP